MTKDRRANTVKFLIESGHVTQFSQIFEHIPKTVVAQELGFNYERFRKVIEKVDELKVADISLLSGYFGIDEMKMFELIYTQRHAKKSPRKK